MICLGILQETRWWWVSWTLAKAEEQRERAAVVLTLGRRRQQVSVKSGPYQNAHVYVIH